MITIQLLSPFLYFISFQGKTYFKQIQKGYPDVIFNIGSHSIIFRKVDGKQPVISPIVFIRYFTSKPFFLLHSPTNGFTAREPVLAVAGIWKKDKPDNFINNRNSSGNTDGYESTGDVQCEADDDIHFRDYITILKHNKPIRMLVIAAASNKFASMVYSNSTVLVMFYGILMDNYALAGVIGMIVGMPNLAIIYAGIHYAQKVGQKKTMIAATWLAVIFQTMLMLMMIFCDLTKVSLFNINLITVLFLLVFTLLNGVKSITNNIVVPMIADCTDYEYSISGHFVPGIMGALFSFIDKSFSALGTGFVGIALSFIGYTKVFPQVEDTLTLQIKWMTIFFYCIIPIIGWLITIFIMRFYKLDKKTMMGLYSDGGKDVDC